MKKLFHSYISFVDPLFSLVIWISITISCVMLAVGQYETASFIRHFLRHPVFNTQSKRRGTVVRVGHIGMKVWRINVEKEEKIK